MASDTAVTVAATSAAAEANSSDAGLRPDGGGGSGSGGGRGAPAWLRQMSSLSDENRRLRVEMSNLQEALRSQSAEALAEKRRLLEVELRPAELWRPVAARGSLATAPAR